MTAFSPPGRVKFNRDDVVVRPARLEDRAAVEAIAAQVWEGNDYLPDVFEAWVKDPTGLFSVVTVREQVVGLGKLTFFPPDQWWLEGLRVDPAYRGQGIARILHHYLVNRVRQHAPGVLRYSTAADNVAIHKLAHETGFRHVATFIPYGAAAQASPTDGLIALRAADAGRAWAFLQTAPYFDAAQRTLEEYWRFLPLTPAVLGERATAGLVYGWTGNAAGVDLRGLAVLNAFDEDDAPDQLYVRIGYLDAVPGDLTPLALALRGLAAALGRHRVSLKPLKHPDLLRDLEAAGYERRWDNEIYLYARDLSLTAYAEVVGEQ